MSESHWELSLQDALLATASAAPTPGGGSIAPVAGAFGLGLVLMALEVTHGKQPSAELQAQLERGRALLSELSAFADRDVAVFGAYMQATALPKHTPVEQAARTAARDAAILNAADTPLMAAEVCVRALQYAESVATAVQKNVHSDLLAGADILLGAVRAVLRTVAINLPHLKDAAVREQFSLRAAQLAEQAETSYARIGA